jgi:hypothetical protein
MLLKVSLRRFARTGRIRQTNYCLISPQLLKACPFQLPVFKHCCCRRTHTVEAQSGRPVLAAQTAPHLSNILVQLKPPVTCRFRDASGSRRSGAIAATVPSRVGCDTAFGCLIWTGLASLRSLGFSDPGFETPSIVEAARLGGIVHKR